MLHFNKIEQKVWDKFVAKYDLSEEKSDQLKKYLSLLIETNKKINLTAITSVVDVIKYHFDDSLMISKFVDIKNVKSVCDIGTGGGFPGVPLKIVFPHINLFLVEVVQKKVNFLKKVADELSLKNITFIDFDWRTFLRSTNYEIDLFCARASLQPEELVRVFKPVSPYKNSKLVYWASAKWEPSEKVALFIKSEKEYSVGERKRKFVFFSL